MMKFLLTNFGEMNMLWVRMQYQVTEHDRQKAEEERRNISVLIGTNLLILSDLESMTADIYVAQVLPTVFEHILGCKDILAQEYIVECLIEVIHNFFHLKRDLINEGPQLLIFYFNPKVFPDEFHFKALPIFLSFLDRLEKDVHIKTMLQPLMVRFSSMCETKQTLTAEEHTILESFYDQCKKLIEVCYVGLKIL
jgi:hypothetical protein